MEAFNNLDNIIQSEGNSPNDNLLYILKNVRNE